mmetsp:Transcript_3687/g.5160  ORF Transcript_3687/g.5160 Transcript_3687/m.5160 type:complete len:193 (+) Transcript_3687:74-652(+)
MYFFKKSLNLFETDSLKIIVASLFLLSFCFNLNNSVGFISPVLPHLKHKNAHSLLAPTSRNNHKSMQMIAGPASFALVGWTVAVLASPLELTQSKVNQGEKIFEQSCIGCHVGGGNVIGYARGKTLKKKALEKNDLDTPQKIVTLLEEGKGVMPRYGKYVDKDGKTVQAKLSSDEMEAVAEYIIFQAENGWK